MNIEANPKIKNVEETENSENELRFELDVKDENKNQALKELISKNFRGEEEPMPLTIDIKTESGIITEKLKPCEESGAYKLIETADIFHRTAKNSAPTSLRQYAPASIKLFDLDYNSLLCDHPYIHPYIQESQRKKLSTFFAMSFLQLDEFHEIETPVILYSGNDISKAAGIISFLHEIGHTHQEINEGAIKNDTSLQTRIIARYEQAVIGKRVVPNEDEIMIKLHKNSPAAPIPLKLWRQFINSRSKMERDAWAFALKILIAERKKGNDLAPGFNKEKIDKFLYEGELSPLGSYETNLLCNFQEFSSEDKKIKRKFVKILKH